MGLANGEKFYMFSDLNCQNNTGFVQKCDCGFLDFSRTKLLLFPDFSMHFVHLYVNKNITKLAFNAEISYTKYSSILNAEWYSNF